MRSSQIAALCLLCIFTIGAKPDFSPSISPSFTSVNAPFHLGKMLYIDDFHHGLAQWRIEQEESRKITASQWVLDIDVPAGITLWFKPEIKGPIMISYDATVISNEGPNDRVSDLNCFWMATDPLDPTNNFCSSSQRQIFRLQSAVYLLCGAGR